MTNAELERLLKLVALGQQAFLEVLNIINNHKAQAGKTEVEILNDAEQKTKEALEIINNL